MPAASIGVTVDTRIPDPGRWDAAVAHGGAPVFYRASVLESYGAHPLQPTIDVRYLTVTEDGETAAVLPFYLVPARDPFGGPARRGTWAISHFWHCYDTRLPASRTGNAAGLTRAVWDVMAAQAAEWGAERFGFTNVAAGNAGDGSAAVKNINDRNSVIQNGGGRLVPQTFPLAGARAIPRDPRYRIPLAGAGGFEEHLTRLPPAVRQDARRQLRLAARAGVVGRVYRDPLPPAIVDAACRLLALTADRYNPGYYDRLPMEHLLTHAGPRLRVPVLERDGRVSAASISFLDGQTWHNWAIGVEPQLRRLFSPYLVLLALTVDHAAGSGCRAVEMGRTNPEWKQRVGAEPVDLVSWMARASG